MPPVSPPQSPGCAGFTRLPIAVGFGIRTPQQAAEVARAADAAVVGSALVQRLALNLNPDNTAKPCLVEAVLADVRALAEGVRGARTPLLYVMPVSRAYVSGRPRGSVTGIL